ncbi:hypothetical protein OH458_22005 [Vibrio sp. MarTm2]|nr:MULTISPECIES: hypothetical protein [Vibrio]MDA0130737.1 hypothetical protein [Vibrio sp. MarTm2]MDA0130739.1 hypothetical protein [Vibrio sp. MarTm2]CAK4070783.1 hypothetical protein VDT1_2661 [Vibrio sp. 16]
MPFLLPVVFLGGGIVGFQLSEGSSKLVMMLVLLVVGYALLKGGL